LRLIARQFYNTYAMIVIDLADENATSALAARIARRARRQDVIALKGDLGTGKTTFARAFIRARGNQQDEIPSPTFTLVQIYEPESAQAPAVWHFDLYRLRVSEEAWELGIEDAFNEGISLIEWPERLGSLLPPRRLRITLEFGDRTEARRVSLDPGTGWQARLTAIAADA
jgi:tRNA threonylcarbamoyl adenosine modification protein YjeE